MPASYFHISLMLLVHEVVLHSPPSPHRPLWWVSPASGAAVGPFGLSLLTWLCLPLALIGFWCVHSCLLHPYPSSRGVLPPLVCQELLGLLPHPTQHRWCQRTNTLFRPSYFIFQVGSPIWRGRSDVYLYADTGRSSHTCLSCNPYISMHILFFFSSTSICYFYHIFGDFYLPTPGGMSV